MGQENFSPQHRLQKGRRNRLVSRAVGRWGILGILDMDACPSCITLGTHHTDWNSQRLGAAGNGALCSRGADRARKGLIVPEVN